MAQAWGEAMDIYNQANGKVRLTLPKKLEADALAAQTHYLEENPRIGMIQEWLDRCEHDRVCAMMIWREALGHEFDEPQLKSVNEIHNIMRNSVAGWKYIGKQKMGIYGIQRAYERADKDNFIDAEGVEIPFC